MFIYLQYSTYHISKNIALGCALLSSNSHSCYAAGVVGGWTTIYTEVPKTWVQIPAMAFSTVIFIFVLFLQQIELSEWKANYILFTFRTTGVFQSLKFSVVVLQVTGNCCNLVYFFLKRIFLWSFNGILFQ